MVFRYYTKFALLLFLVVATSLIGCSQLRPFGKDKKKQGENSLAPFGRATLIRDYASPSNMHFAAIEGFGVIWNLRGTGSEVPPGFDREYVLRELQKRQVVRPEELLSTKNTSVVRLQGIIMPGMRAGDRFDVKIGLPPGSSTESLQGGILLRTTLSEAVQIGFTAKTGFPLADVEGPVMLNPNADPKANPMSLVSGKILGGGVLKKNRPLYLLLKDEHTSEIISDRIAKQINERFFTKESYKTKGVATAKTDRTVEIQVHPTYKDNIERYMQVLLSVACYETQTQRVKRIETLKTALLVPETAQDSALQLEAIGKHGLEPLRAAVMSQNVEVRFYAAESLAYLGEFQAARPLAEIARSEQAFRVRALSALGNMKTELEASTCLRELLNENSAETRYGAFRALWYRNPDDLAIRGETLGADESSQFSYHVLETSGPPMIHFTNSKRPELVLFNANIRLIPNFVMDAGISILVRSVGPDEVVVSRINPSGMDERRTVTPQLDEIIRAVVELGGTYPDVVQMLQEAARQKALPCRLEVDKLPQGGRIYSRRGEEEEEFPDIEKKRGFWSRFRMKKNDPVEISEFTDD